MPGVIINARKIEKIIADAKFNKNDFFGVLEKAAKLKGLYLKESVVLIAAPKKYSDLIFKTAGFIRKEIYGSRMVLFAPLYWSDFCLNRCAYCGFQAQNNTARRKLSLKEVQQQTEALLDMGHKRILLECGEDPLNNSVDYLLRVIKTIYQTKNQKGDFIRRINVNIAATTVENYKKLAKAGIGTYNLFQETYHRPTYEKIHPRGTLKHNYERQLSAHSRAIKGGLQDLGLGVLFGLYDWRFEILALISHARYLDKTFGIGPHTVSVPRIKNAGVNFQIPSPVSDDDFLKIISVLRLSIPYTGIILSTRESAFIRDRAFSIGVSQISAASKTEVGGYQSELRIKNQESRIKNKIHNSKFQIPNSKNTGQFEIYDNRSLDEIVFELLNQNFIPSWCTGCEYKGRVGCSFLAIAKAGLIKNFCAPNALLTLKEYLTNYASTKTQKLGEIMIKKELRFLPEKKQSLVKGWLKQLEDGQKKYFYF